MSAPPGYNASDSLLQPQVQAHGGTPSIVPVMGGGRVRGALKKIRRKHTKRGVSKKKGKTKKHKNRRLSQRGGVNHYSLPTRDLIDHNDLSVSITIIGLPSKETITDPNNPIDFPISFDETKFKEYLIQQNKLWVRNLRETLFKNASLKSNLPNFDNIGCFINKNRESRDRKPRLYSPDRLCCILPKETGTITVLPSVNGKMNTFKLALTAIKNDMVNNNVFIFSPPFFGDIPSENIDLFNAFLNYKVQGLQDMNRYLFYILTDYSILNIEMAKVVSKNIYNANKQLISDTISGELKNPTTTPEGKREEDKRLVGEGITMALYQMLEPTYIIYPYTINVPVVTVGSIIEDSRIKQGIQDTDDLKKLEANLKEAQEALNKIRVEISDKQTALAAAAAPNKPVLEAGLAILRQKEAIENRRLKSLEATRYVIPTPSPIPSKRANTPGKTEEKGGILFSAANKEEPILPAPYSGFDGPIQYIQTNDKNTERRSIAYRPDFSKNDPLLYTMNYKEYNLLLKPPMNSNSIYVLIFKNNTSGEPSKDGNSEIFLPSTKTPHMRVPGTAISVGLKEFVVRNPVPDVVADWESGIYSQDESDYLNAMKLTPEILRTVFKEKWKKEVSNHLSMITRSNCFKDTRLILHSECQDAQKFISEIMKYYTQNSDILGRLRRQQDTDYISRLQSALDSKMNQDYEKITDSIFIHTEFVRAFYAPKTGAGVNKPIFLVSVSPIIVSRIGTEFKVSHDEDLEPDMEASIMRELKKYLKESGTATETEIELTLTKEGNIWKFSKPVNMYKLTRISRAQLPSFTITSVEQYSDEDSSNEIYVCYFGELSKEDEQLINTTTGCEITDKKDREDGLYKWTLNKKVSLKEYEQKLKEIANTNKYHFTFEKRKRSSYEDINYLSPTLFFDTGRATITIIMREKAEPDKDITVDFSLNLYSGLNMDKISDTLLTEFGRIAIIVNKGGLGPGGFGGKYVISTGTYA